MTSSSLLVVEVWESAGKLIDNQYSHAVAARNAEPKPQNPSTILEDLCSFSIILSGKHQSEI